VLRKERYKMKKKLEVLRKGPFPREEGDALATNPNQL